MGVNEHERLYNITLRQKLKLRNSTLIAKYATSRTIDILHY